jgi:hypothetical protein
LQCFIQDGQMQLMDEDSTVQVDLTVLKSAIVR